MSVECLVFSVEGFVVSVEGLIDSCITQLKARGPSRTCNESTEEEKEGYRGTSLTRNTLPSRTTMGPEAQGYCRVLRGGCFLC